ncbi:hypothetical protein [Evansella cellulosilytica]|uniref:Uncharacterized protein n=1 Tax=Evansella cellulosilytica (strain ATCC 21833 / DSM 2522 / FERM P-1141 / JCM 9156 / N-4) TaxID=649639 RepID=E6U1L3_EVAC2|nr:hypothetical protein [Evansella cellulosilytica]ADU30376.1 hypothetical protein Bcell_2115 [Evansella cellulosilytica DSM 2522]
MDNSTMIQKNKVIMDKVALELGHKELVILQMQSQIEDLIEENTRLKNEAETNNAK